MKILRLGHAMYVFTTKQQKKLLVDPFFDMNPGCPSEYGKPDFLKTIDAVLLTHGHFDHTSGLNKVLEVKPDVLVIAQYELALILMQQGIKNVYPLNFGGSIDLEDTKVTMVKAVHTSSYGETVGTPVYAGEACGYILDFKDDVTLYHSGDTAIMMDMKLIQDIYQPDIAILSSSGQFTMGPKEAAYAVNHLLDVKIVIPSHTFPTKKNAPSKEAMERLMSNFPIIENMMDKDKELVELLKDNNKTRVLTIGYGEEKEISLSNEQLVNPII
ncbi:MAG TPA: metal-dependent hydrolase [Bacillus sp. (in: firmicutes)]|nr:metal-dependent hydrolase [Bacillus sp. (in: firmicutes)]